MRIETDHSIPIRQIRFYALLALLAWSLLCGMIVFNSYRNGQQGVLADARIMARTSIDKDIAYRHWVAEKGGVYVAISQNTPINRYLNAPEREITTPSGRQLTLINPAYMTRQVFEQEFKLQTSLNSHISSLKPLRPKNRPDSWETEAFANIARGAIEYGTAWQHDGAAAYRYMRPLTTEKACLRCHADQGYQVGDVRGGISVIVPLAELLATQQQQQQIIATTLGAVWLAGLFGIWFSWRKILRATMHIQQQHDNLQLLFEAAPNGMLLFDRSGEIVMDNATFREKHSPALSSRSKRFGEIFNCENTEDDPRGCGWGHNCQICPIRDALQAAFDRQLVSRDKECTIPSTDSQTPPWVFLFSVTPLQVNGEQRALLVLADITNQKLAEQERETFRSQLLQAQKVEAIGRLAGGVAHDFNNMLAIISGNVELALRKLESDKSIKNHLCQIKETTSRSADLTRQLLGFARKQTMKPQVLKLNNEIEATLQMLRRLIGEDIELVWKPATLNLKVLIDSAQLNQILTNLVVNARDAIATKGNLVLSTDLTFIDEDYCQNHPWCKSGEYVQLLVSDDGCGMSKTVLEHIFEPFYTTKDIDKGTGLGLATVYGIIKQNHGFINVYSEPSHGTTVSIYFPSSNAEAPEETADSQAASARGDETILLVEDEAVLLEICQQTLEEAGYQVIASSDPLTALQLAAAHDKPIDLLLTDVIMPKLNGKELAERLLVMQPAVKVIYMSGYAADIIATRGLLADGVQLLQKPFATEILTQKLRKVLDS